MRPPRPRSPPPSFAPSAQAKFFELRQADVVARVEPNGALRVRERILFDFVGSFTGAYRDIPLREGESIDGVFVSEGSERYRPGASAELGSFGLPGTFGTERLDDGFRIVWHYSAADEGRTFTIGYRLSGLTVAYDDVADVNLKVWGDEWEQRLDNLTARIELPGRARGPAYRVWGHPAWVRGEVRKTPRAALLQAFDVPPKQFVELRTVFPRSLLQSTAGARVVDGPGLQKIVAEERDDAAAYERDRDRIDNALDHIVRYVLLLLLLAIGPALLVAGAVYVLFGRERKTGYDREYEQEPPSSCHRRSSHRSSSRAPASARWSSRPRSSI